MVKKFIKNLIAVAVMGLMIVSPLNIFAAEMPNNTNIHTIKQEEADSNISLLSSNSFTIELPHDKASTSRRVNMGFNPTVRVTARGNPNMTFKVWVVNPVGIQGEVGYVRGDGSTIEKNLFMSIGGDYFVYVQMWGGSTNGKSAYFDFQVTW